MEKLINYPFEKGKLKELRVGDRILLSGTIYTARDAAHERMVREYEKTKQFPIDLKNQAIYYAGPCPAKPGEVIGSCGPTTAGRMDAYTPLLLDNGLSVMIGKGARNKEVTDAIVRNSCVYLGATGGAGALIAQCIKECELVCYEDLGTEAIRRLRVENLPLVVLTDSKGNDLYKKNSV
ncbi:MAG: Fe-S-containing hydro-lyase [Clostridia bacterium]|nr:Fe-S-containing hydro-lyase [Clostridia bacterium]